MTTTTTAAAYAETRADSGARSLPSAPYRGIEPFRFVDRPIFFAREAETRRLLRYVAVYRGVLFYGDSGSGKSSLVNAGFIPAIIEEGFTPDRLRVQPRPGEEIVVERISRSPEGGAPFLPSNFAGEGDAASRVVMAAAELRGRLKALPAERRPLLIFDQFEEFATLFEDAPRGDAVRQAREAQESVLKAVVELLRDPALPVKLLFVFREDYLAKLNKLIALFPDLSDQYLRLTPPATSSLREIIRGSFEKFPGQFSKEISEDLARQLASAIEERSESGRLNLSEVQIACLELWKSDRPEELFEEKGVQGLLEGYLSDSLSRLPASLRDPAIALLDRMVTPSGTRNIVSEYDLICQGSKDERIPQDRLRDALRALVEESRLVRREPRYDTYFYDIVSEFLVPWILRQKSERLARAALRRKATTFISAVGLLLVVAGMVGSWYVYKSRTQAALAMEAVKQAKEEKTLADSLRAKAESEKIAAERDRDEAQREAEFQAGLAANVERNAAELKAQFHDTNTRFKELVDQAAMLRKRLNDSEEQRSVSEAKLQELQAQAAELKEELNKCRKSSPAQKR